MFRIPTSRGRITLTVATAIWMTSAAVGSTPRAAAPAQTAPAPGAASAKASAPKPATDPRQTITTYCVTCHNARTNTGGLALDLLDPANAATHADVWEK